MTQAMTVKLRHNVYSSTSNEIAILLASLFIVLFRFLFGYQLATKFTILFANLVFYLFVTLSAILLSISFSMIKNIFLKILMHLLIDSIQTGPMVCSLSNNCDVWVLSKNGQDSFEESGIMELASSNSCRYSEVHNCQRLERITIHFNWTFTTYIHIPKPSSWD